jgi:hypothetical protein
MNNRNHIMIKTIGKKIEAALSLVKPPIRQFEIFASETGLDQTYIIRIVTSSWANMDKARRIAKVESLFSPALSESERERIFRISVLTPQEWETVRPDLIGTKKLRIRSNKATAISVRN